MGKMKRLIAILLCLALAPSASATTLAEAVAALRGQTVCIPAVQYHGAVSAMFMQTLEIYALRARVAELERELAKK